jgi:hypothetical protein
MTELEEAAEKYANEWEEIHPTLDPEDMTPIEVSKIDFIAGAKWQSERMFSEEEVGELVYNIIGEYGKHYGIMIDGAKLNDLFEQFKKK